METNDEMHLRTVRVVPNVPAKYRSDRPGFTSRPLGPNVGEQITIAANVYDPFTGQRIAKKGDVGTVIADGEVVQIRLRR
jgi:hypothetical protein